MIRKLAKKKEIELTQIMFEDSNSSIEERGKVAFAQSIAITPTQINDILLKIMLSNNEEELPGFIRVFFFDQYADYFHSELINLRKRDSSKRLKFHPHPSTFFNKAFAVNKIGFSTHDKLPSKEVKFAVEVVEGPM